MEEYEDAKENRIRELEEELARMKGEVVITEEEYKGHPVLRFSGAFRPFSLGVSKCKVILKSFDRIKSFIEKHDKNS